MLESYRICWIKLMVILKDIGVDWREMFGCLQNL